MVEIIKSASGGDTVFAVDAPNWIGTSTPVLKIGVAKSSLQGRATRGLRYMLGQFYGVVDTGLIEAQHVFRGLRRSMHVGDNDDAAKEKLAATWAAPRDARMAGDKSDATLEFLPVPDSKVFAVYISVNKMLEEYPSIYGWAEHWTWIQSDPVVVGAPIQWLDRYDSRIWTAS